MCFPSTLRLVISTLPRDMIGSMGITPRRLPFTKANNEIRYFRYALAPDEIEHTYWKSFG